MQDDHREQDGALPAAVGEPADDRDAEASPIAAAALARPPTATEPLEAVTSPSTARGTIVIGRRPSAVTGR